MLVGQVPPWPQRIGNKATNFPTGTTKVERHQLVASSTPAASTTKHARALLAPSLSKLPEQIFGDGRIIVSGNLNGN